MKLKILILLLTLTLGACFDNQFEIKQNQHITELETNLKVVIVNYAQQAQSINTVEEIIRHHKTALNEFNQITSEFSQFRDEKRLHTIISLYDYAFTPSILKQLQIIQQASPIWNRDITELEKIKDFTYFKNHQQFLDEILLTIDNNQKSLANHHEEVREMLVSSTLDEQDRKRLWRVFNDLTAKHIAALNHLIHPIKTRVESEKELSAFFYKNRDGYAVSELKGLEFFSFELLDSYNLKLKTMNKKYNAARAIDRLSKP